MVIKMLSRFRPLFRIPFRAISGKDQTELLHRKGRGDQERYFNKKQRESLKRLLQKMEDQDIESEDEMQVNEKKRARLISILRSHNTRLPERVVESLIRWKKGEIQIILGQQMGCVSQKTKKSVNIKNISQVQTEQQPTTINRKSLLQITRKTFLKLNFGGLPSEYTLLGQLGEGAFSEVRKCFHKPTNSFRAVKRIDKTGLVSTQYMDQNNQILQQIQILRNLDHPNILKSLDFFQDQKNFYIVSQLCQGGELLERILSIQSFTEQIAAVIIKQLLSVISYCHSKNIIHRDLKPQNLLFENPNSLNLKVADFGSSTILNRRRRLNGIFGSAYYVAPEVLTGDYNEKCDIWSIGIIMFILLTGRPPYQGKTEHQIIDIVRMEPLNIDKENFPNISKQAIQLLENLLIVDYRARISASSALNHPWILKAQNKKTHPISHIFESLKNFSYRGKLNQAVKVFIASQITTEQEAVQLKEAFQTLDSNNDGKISKEELLEFYKKGYNMREAQEIVEELMEKVDVDCSGFIDYTEFLRAGIQANNSMNYKMVVHAFQVFDVDNSGYITSEELKEILQGENQVQSHVWQDILDEVDSNGDGIIDFQEFVNLVSNKL